MQFRRPLENVSRPDNYILANLPEAEFALLSRSMSRIGLPLGFQFSGPRDTAEYIYFPTAGVVSTTAVTEAGEVVEIGMTGNDGLIGINALLGQPDSMHSIVMQVAGEGCRVKVTVARSPDDSITCARRWSGIPIGVGRFRRT